MYENEIFELNEKVSNALEERRNFLDSKMEEVSKFKIGEAIYDLLSGKKLGIVSKLYRYHRNNPIFDTSLDVEYQFETEPGSLCFSNTSSIPGTRFGTLSELIEDREYQLLKLRKE